MKKLLAIVLSMMLVLSLTACGGKDYTGKYSLTSIKVEGMEIKKGDSMWNTAFSDKDKAPYLELKKDDKFTLLFELLDSESQDGTFKVDGEKITLKTDSKSIEGKIKDNKITLEIEGCEAVFELDK